MRIRSRTFALLAASLLALGATACGDDDTEGSVTAAETTDDGTVDDAAVEPDDNGESGENAERGDPAEPCTLLTAEDFESALEVSISEGEDVSDRFTIGGPEVDSPACQWEATTSGDGVAVSVYSVELVTVPEDADGQLYADVIENAEFFDDQVSDIDVGDEAVSIDDGDSPEVLVRRGDVLLKLSTSSDDVTIDELLTLVEAAVGRVEAG